MSKETRNRGRQAGQPVDFTIENQYRRDKAPGMLREVDKERRRVRQGVQAAARNLFVTLGLGEGTADQPLHSNLSIASIGAGNAQVERMVYGERLEGLSPDGKYLGFDAEYKPTIPLKCAGGFQDGVNILKEEDHPKVLDADPDILLDIDTLTSFPPTKENLDKYFALVRKHMAKDGKRYAQVITFPATHYHWAPMFHLNNFDSASNMASTINTAVSRKPGIYALEGDDLATAAEALFPEDLFHKVREGQSLIPFLEHGDQLVQRYMVDGRQIWGVPFSSKATMESIARYIRQTPQELMDSLKWPVTLADPNDPIHRISAAFTIAERLGQGGQLMDRGIERDYSYKLGSPVALTFSVLHNSFQAGAFEAVVQRRLRADGLKVEEIVQDGAVTTSEHSQRFPANMKPPTGQRPPFIIATDSHKNLADRRDWMLGIPLHTRQSEGIGPVVEGARLVALKAAA